MNFDIAALNFVDYIVITILMVSAVLSTLRGMTREALGLVGWPIAIFAAKYAAPVIEPTITDVIRIEGIGQALAWALPFAVTVVFWFVLSNMLSPGLKRAGLGALDNWLGVVFGLIRGYVIVLLIYAVAVVIMAGEPRQVGEAALTPLIRNGVINLSGVVPEDMRKNILDNVPATPDTGVGDTMKDAVAPMKDAVGDAMNGAETNLDLLKDEVQSQ